MAIANRVDWARLALPLRFVRFFYIRFMYNPEKHHRHSVRLKNYCYSDGFYFVTACCENRICVFGKIEDGTMTRNELGEIAQNEWLRTAEIRSNVKMHEFVVMPNHVHGILEINNAVPTVGARRALPSNNDLPCNKDSQLPLRFQNQGKNTLSSIIGAYKSAVSKRIHETGFMGKIWQRNYYEHVIRDTQSYWKISQYVLNNPANWQDDDFFINDSPQ
jgi:REP element-mobilizing transposase RayT